MSELSPGAKELREILGNLLDEKLKSINTNLDSLMNHGQTSNERLTSIERRLAAIEKHVGMNGARFVDTEPAPATQPENERPEEA